MLIRNYSIEFQDAKTNIKSIDNSLVVLGQSVHMIAHLIRRRQVYAAIQREQEDAFDQQSGEHEGSREAHQPESGAGQWILTEGGSGRETRQEEEAEKQGLAQEQVSSVRCRCSSLEQCQ